MPARPIELSIDGFYRRILCALGFGPSHGGVLGTVQTIGPRSDGGRIVRLFGTSCFGKSRLPHVYRYRAYETAGRAIQYALGEVKTVCPDAFIATLATEAAGYTSTLTFVIGGSSVVCICSWNSDRAQSMTSADRARRVCLSSSLILSMLQKTETVDESAFASTVPTKRRCVCEGASANRASDRGLAASHLRTSRVEIARATENVRQMRRFVPSDAGDAGDAGDAEVPSCKFEDLCVLVFAFRSLAAISSDFFSSPMHCKVSRQLVHGA